MCYNYVFNRYILNLATSLIKVVTGRETLEFSQAKVGQVLGKQSIAVIFGPISISLPSSLKAKFHEFIFFKRDNTTKKIFRARFLKAQ